MTAPPPQFSSASLYVGQLGYEIAEGDLFEVFKTIGSIASIRVCRDAITRRSLGYGYVNFHNVQDAERALDVLNYTKIGDRPCRIMWSHRDPSKRRSGVGNIFIKNLDKNQIDNQNLYDTFSAFGNILSCKVETDENGNSKGYGYVHFETQEAADEAIAKVNNMMLADKVVTVTKFRPKREREVERNNNFTNVFIKNLAKNTTTKDLIEAFQKYGEIQNAVAMNDNNEQCRGFGFVNFVKPESAVASLEVNGRELFGQTVYVGRAQKRIERQQELKKLWEERKLENMQKYQGVNLYIKNLDESITEEMLTKEFSTCGTITSTKIMRDERGVSRGFGFVCFSSPEEATKAVAELNGAMKVGKPLYVALAQRLEVRRAQLALQYQQRLQYRNIAPIPSQVYVPGGGPFFPGSRQGPPPNYRRWQNSQGGPPPGRPGPYTNQPFQGSGAPAGNRPQTRPGNTNPANRNSGRPQTQTGGPKRPTGPSQPRQNPQYSNRGSNPNSSVRPQSAPQVNPAVGPLPSLAQLQSMPKEDANSILGEKIYTLISQKDPEEAGKITGMLLEKLSNEAALALLENPEDLNNLVVEAQNTLKSVQPQN